jgi:hypothetical protein
MCLTSYLQVPNRLAHGLHRAAAISLFGDLQRISLNGSRGVKALHVAQVIPQEALSVYVDLFRVIEVVVDPLVQ